MRENKFRKWIRTEIETEAEALEAGFLSPYDAQDTTDSTGDAR